MQSINPISDLPEDKLERIMMFRNSLLALCEGRNNMDDSVYRFLRREFMNDPNISDLLPQFVRAAQDTGAMWAFFKAHSPQWEPRRQFVREQFTPLIDRMERPSHQAVNPLSSQVLNRAENREKPMYNLFVSGFEGSWEGEPWTVESSRCVNEHTDDLLIKQYGSLDEQAKDFLKKLPCLFAYEAGCKKAPKFGVIKDVIKRQGQVRVEYEIIPVDSFLSDEDLSLMRFELDIGKLELNRTHWAVKEVDLAKELNSRGIALPKWTQSTAKSVDISSHRFDVALSFPGEVRDIVEDVANNLESLIGPNSYFYDNKYISQLARPALDVLLQDLYRNRAKLIVVFLSADYQRKDWCGIEFRAIRDIIAERNHARIMFVRTDDGSVEGVFSTDGYVDARRFGAAEIARFIKERVDLLL